MKGSTQFMAIVGNEEKRDYVAALSKVENGSGNMTTGPLASVKFNPENTLNPVLKPTA